MADDLPFFRGQQIPESVRANLMAAKLLQQSGAAQTGPYTSGGVTALKALSGLLGGFQEHAAIQGEMQAQAAHRSALAQALLSGGGLGAAGAVGAGTAAPAAPAAVPPPSAASGGDALSSPISTASQNAFIQSALPHAQAVAAQTGIDPRLIVAQAALESNYGKAAPGGNLFGIKATGGQPSTGPIGTKEAVGGTLTPTLASFAAYGSPEASFAGYGKLMSHDRYAGVRNGATLDDQLSALGKSGYATDPNYAAKVGAIARGIDAGTPGPAAQPAPGARPLTIAADAPAPNAQPVASNSLPPGITPDMVSAPPPAASPYGAMPSSMAQRQPSPDAAALAAALRGQAGSGPGAAPSPFGAMPAGMDQPAAPPPPPPMMASAPPVDDSAQPLTVQGAEAPPSISPVPTAQQPADAAPAPDPKMLAAMLAQGAPTPGAPALSPGDAPLPPPGAQSGAQPGNPFGGPPQPMAPPPSAGPAPTPLSPAGAVMGAMGPGDLPPDMGADLATGVANRAPPQTGLPIMARQSANPPGVMAQDFAAPQGSPPPSALAAALRSPAGAQPAPDLPQTGPMPPPGVQSLAAAARPDAPAPNVAPAGPAPLPPGLAQAMAQQPMGLPGNSPTSDPSSAVNFNIQEARRAQGGQPPASLLGAALRGPSSPAAAPGQGQGGMLDMMGGIFGGGGMGGGMGGGQPQGGTGNPLAGLFGGGMGGGFGLPFGGGAGSGAGSPALGGQGQGQPFTPGGQGGQGGQPGQAGAQTGIPGVSQNQLLAILSDPRTTPQEAQILMSRLAPQPEKLSAGEGLVVRQPDGSYKTVATQAPKADWTFNPETGRITNSATGEQRQVNAPIEHFETNREGLTTNTRTGQVTANPGAGYRFMTEGEKKAAGIPLDQPMQVGPNGEMHAASGQTINVGGEQNVYDTGMAKTLVENHQSLMQGVDANRTKLRDLNLMSGALQRLQQNGGTTGMGAEEKLHVQSAINTAANTLGLGQQFQVDDPEVIGKIQRQIAGASAKDIGGARTTNFDMEQMLQANPGLGLSATGNQRMLGIAQQVAQRNIDVGQQMQDAAAQAVRDGRRVNPVDMEAIRQNYDQSHHIVDPITGQDITASPRLPEFQRQGSAASPSSPSGAAPGPNMPTPTSQPVQVQTRDDAMRLPPGTVFMTPDGRRLVR